jgi:hypothetical protein
MSEQILLLFLQLITKGKFAFLAFAIFLAFSKTIDVCQNKQLCNIATYHAKKYMQGFYISDTNHTVEYK